MQINYGLQVLHLNISNFVFINNLYASGTNISTTEEVAIKLECIKSKHPQLHIEAKFYKMMQSGGVYVSVFVCVFDLSVCWGHLVYVCSISVMFV